MSKIEQLNEKTDDLTGKSLSFDEVFEELNNTSPLKMSKKLIDFELYDQQSSLEVMDKIYEEFDNKDNVVDSLVNPLLLSIGDGLVKHPKLKGTFRKTNITPSRFVNEVNSFIYTNNTKKKLDDDPFLTQAEKSFYNNQKLGTDKNGNKTNNNFHRNTFYDKKPRTETEREKGINRAKDPTVIDEITGKKLDLTKKGAKEKGISSADMDHVNPINAIRKKYQNNPYLYRDDLEKIIGLPENESYINSSLNQSKGDMTWSEYIEKYPDKLSEKEKAKALELEKNATKAQNKAAAKAMAKNIGLKGLGDIIILILKPIWYEIKDMFKNGVLYGFNTNDKVEAFLLRLKRVSKFISENVLKTLGDSLKDVFANFIPMMIKSIAEIFTGIFKKIIQVISDGFMAIKEAFKIMMKPSTEISSAQKADAISKIIVGAIIPILAFAFEESIFSFLKGTPFDFLKDIATIIISGLGTTLVVWFLDQIDLFSIKDEKRLERVKEIFSLRIENIKNNTDIYEKSSIEALAKQKLQFKKLSEELNSSIKSGKNVNDSVLNMSSFFNIDLNVKETDDFINMLIKNKELRI